MVQGYIFCDKALNSLCCYKVVRNAHCQNYKTCPDMKLNAAGGITLLQHKQLNKTSRIEYQVFLYRGLALLAEGKD